MGKRLRAVVAACALATCMVLALTGCSDNSNYEPESKSPAVSSPTIAQAGTLRVGVDTSKSPLAGVGNDKIIGMDVDVASAIADELGLKVSIVDVGSDPEEALKQGKVDIVMGIDSANYTGDVWLSEAYLPSGVALFSTNENAKAPSVNSDVTIAAQLSSTSAWAVSNEFGEDALTSTQNLGDAFTQLSSGKVDFVAADAVIGRYAAHRQDVDVSVVALMSRLGGYCIGVSKTNSELQSVVTEVVDKLTSTGIVDLIEAKWLGEAVDLSDVSLTAGATSAKTTSTTEDDVDDETTADDAEDGDAAETQGGASTNAGAASQANSAQQQTATLEL